MNIDADFRMPGDGVNCRYILVVIMDTPKYDFDYETLWQRLMGRLLGTKIRYTYFHIGQIVVCDTDEDWASPRETPWGAKPGKHNCRIKKFTDLAEAIQCSQDVIDNS